MSANSRLAFFVSPELDEGMVKKKYYDKTKLPIFIEWICLEENMNEEHAEQLVKIMKKVPSKLNLIEFNPLANKSFKPASQDNIDKFSKIIQDNGYQIKSN